MRLEQGRSSGRHARSHVFRRFIGFLTSLFLSTQIRVNKCLIRKNTDLPNGTLLSHRRFIDNFDIE